MPPTTPNPGPYDLDPFQSDVTALGWGNGGGPLPPPEGTWEVTNVRYFTAPDPGIDDGLRISDCAGGPLDPGDYKGVSMAAFSIPEALARSLVEGTPLHALGDRSGYVYTFEPPYTCNYINGPPGGSRPLDLPGSGEFKPFTAWELLDPTTVYQAVYQVPRINDRDSHVSADNISWFDATLVPNPDDLIDLSDPWTVTGVRTVPANTGGPGNVGSREDCTLDLFPEDCWGINLEAVAPGYIGWASFRFRALQWTGQTGGFTYQHDDRPDVEKRYLCSGVGGVLSRNVLSLKYPAFPLGQALPYEDILGIAGGGDARINRVEIIIPKSAEPAQPVTVGETVLWAFQ